MRTGALIRRFGAVLFLFCIGSATAAAEQAGIRNRDMPLTFEPGSGRDSSPLFVVHEGRYEALLRKCSIDLVSDAQTELSIEFVDCDSRGKVSGQEEVASESNYFYGPDPTRWRTHVSNFASVKYKDVYPGTDLIFYGKNQKLEHDLVLRPGAEASRIRLRFTGPAKFLLRPDGSLRLPAGAGEFILEKPLVYQMTQSGKRNISGGFVLLGPNEVGLSLAKYDRSLPLVIDPVLTYSSYLGGSGLEHASGVATDNSGNVYVTGVTTSADFPTHAALEPACAITPCFATFLTKFNSSGAVLYSTYLAGTGNSSTAIAVDPNQNVVIGGLAGSSTFPTLHSYANFGCCNLVYDFVLSLSPDGSQLNYSTLLGLAQLGNAVYVALDQSGSAYATGQTRDLNFPVTPGAFGAFTFSPVCQKSDMFVAKLKNDGTILYSTAVPGASSLAGCPAAVNEFIPTGISVDAAGNSYVGGQAGPGLPTTGGVIAASFPNDPSSDYFGFALKLNAAASTLSYATYLPGTTVVASVAVQPGGDLFAAGRALTSFQASSSAFQTKIPAGTNCTCNGGFVAHLDNGGTSFLAATYLTGTPASSNAGTDIQSLSLDGSGSVWVGGITGSGDFPLKYPMMNLFPAVHGTGFVTELSPDLTTDLFSTFLSGQTGSQAAYNLFLAPAKAGVIWVAGTTSDVDFPTTSGAAQPTPPPSSPSSGGNNYHAFVSEIDTTVPAGSACLSTTSLNFSNTPINTTSVPESLVIQNCGNGSLKVQNISLSSGLFSETDTCAAPVSPGSSCSVLVTFKPTSLAGQTGAMTINDNGTIGTQTIALGGSSPFVLTAGSGALSATIQAGQTANYPLVLAAGPAFSGTVSFNCAQVPANFTCSVTPPFVPIFANSSINISVKIAAPALSSRYVPSIPNPLMRFVEMLAAALICIIILAEFPLEPGTRSALLAALLMVFCVAIASCGGGSPDPSTSNTSGGSTGGSSTTPTGSYTITISASSNGTSTSLPLTLTVQ